MAIGSPAALPDGTGILSPIGPDSVRGNRFLWMRLRIPSVRPPSGKRVALTEARRVKKISPEPLTGERAAALKSPAHGDQRALLRSEQLGGSELSVEGSGPPPVGSRPATES